MLKLPIACAVSLLLTSSVAAAVGPDAARCEAGVQGSALVVSVSGLKSNAGTLRVQLYGANAAAFLAKGKKRRRVEVPVTAQAMDVCIALPQAGRYAVAVRHDADRNGKSGWNDGGGFSRNPAISLTALKPKHGRVAFDVGPGVHRIPVTMQYRRGLAIGPIRQGG